MTNLNHIINQKAQELYPDLFPGIENSAAEPFRKGVEWATTDPLILQGLLQPFAEWIRTFEALERQNGQWVIESQLSDEQIVKVFIADYKNKEDGQQAD